MLASFKDFRDSVRFEIPPQVLELFSESVPEGYSYRYMGDDRTTCVLLPDDDSAEFPVFDGVGLKLTERQIEELGVCIDDPNAVRRYIDNSLDTFFMDVSAAKALLGGVELPFSEMTKRADGSFVDDGGMIEISHTPQELDIPFEANGETVVVHFCQVPSHEPFVRKLRGEGSALCISLSIDERSLNTSFTARFDCSKGGSVAGCLRSAQVYLGFATGDALVHGKKAFDGQRDEDEIARAKATVQFWRYTLDLEEVLEVSFDPGAPLKRDAARAIARLHECLIIRKAVGLGYKPEEIAFSSGDEGELPTCKKMLLMFPLEEHFELFGIDVAVNSVIGLSGVTLEKTGENEHGEILYSLSYAEDYQCTVLYTLAGQMDDSDDNVEQIKQALLEPLPAGRHY